MEMTNGSQRKGLTDMHRTDASRLLFGVKPNGMRATRVHTAEVSIAILEGNFVDVNVDALGGGEPSGLLIRIFSKVNLMRRIEHLDLE